MPPKSPKIIRRNYRDGLEFIAFASSLLHLLGTQILPLLFVILLEVCRWLWNQISRAEDNTAYGDYMNEWNRDYDDAHPIDVAAWSAGQTPKIDLTKITSSPSIIASAPPQAHSSPSTNDSSRGRSNSKAELLDTYSASDHKQQQTPNIRNTSSSLSSSSISSGSSSPKSDDDSSNTKRRNRPGLPPSLSKIKRFMSQQKRGTHNSPRLATPNQSARRTQADDSFMDAFRKHFLLDTSFKSSS